MDIETERIITVTLACLSFLVTVGSLIATTFFSMRVHKLSKIAINQTDRANELAFWALSEDIRDEIKKATESKEINNKDQVLVEKAQGQEDLNIPKEFKKYFWIKKIFKIFKRKPKN